ncbi:MAG: aminotransferase class I/II-fold pyridoxal phosphate-dependent enzyme [Gemmatimonadetes bacterium]|nr:aminotransferase class I/II-fold pyridoxal phosphate-dependent enzyme [Gemmatimonadota bacterium]NIO30680.1 aminotransferase class I/II-fold pyridoxal phosphate-dependent enzyme [Gemmatimonadota bacterium]
MPSYSRQFSSLPPYALADVPKIKAELIEKGVDVIDLGAGDADQMPPPQTIKAIQEAVTEERMSRYPFQRGLPEFRVKIAEWTKLRFGVDVDPFDEVLPLIGTKEGIAHLPLVYLDPGDAAIIPDPGYYPYFGGTHMLGAEVVEVPLRRENGYLLDWTAVPADKLKKAKLLYLNYPNNPTGGVASDDYFKQAIEFCHQHDLLLINDNAYSEIAFDGYRPPSVLEYEGAREIAVEFHSLSKTFNMTGWRIGWVAGHKETVQALSKVKVYYDTGVFLACQAAGVASLDVWEEFVPKQVAIFQERRDAAVEAFREAGFEVDSPKATLYLWVPIPGGEPAVEFARRILLESGVVLFPGTGMGGGGEGFFRVALTVPAERLREAAQRVAKVL